MPPSTKGSKKFWNFSPSFFGVNLIIAVAITFSFCPSCPFSIDGWIRSIDNFATSFLVSCVLSYGGFLFEYHFDRKMPWIKYPVQRLILESSGYLLYVFITSLILSFFIRSFYRGSVDFQNINWDGLISDTILPLKISVGISFVLISRSFLLEWRKSAIEAEQLKTEQYAQQYQTLKDQLNPHFLFNSLNVLSNLVYDNPDTAAQFIRQLSKIYRYVLEVQQEKLVRLSSELEFAENYLSLQKIRFEEGLIYQIHTVQPTDLYLPPLSLQMLLENAIKHNVASKANPLIIEISIEENRIVVKNNLQLKSSLSEESTGIGLSNIRKRYELLSSEPIEIEESLSSFIVRLPLLNGQKL